MSDGESHPRRVVLSVGIGAYEHEQLDELPKAVADARAIAERFAGDGFEPHPVVDEAHPGLVEALGRVLPAASLRDPGTVLVVYWAGHAGRDPVTDSLRLLGTANGPQDGDMKVVTATNLAQEAGRTRASQVLVLIDACRAGGGVVDAAKVLDAIGAKLERAEHRWFGVVASCRDYEDAIDGAFAAKLLELLRVGPVDRVLRLRWSSYQAGLRGDDLVDALVREWDEDCQSPKQVSSGVPWFVLSNRSTDRVRPSRSSSICCGPRGVAPRARSATGSRGASGRSKPSSGGSPPASPGCAW